MSIKELYDKWVADDRSPYEDRAERAAAVTLPFMFPETGFTKNTDIPDNYVQSLGARAVNHLAAKIVMSLLPPAGHFFRYEPDADALEQLVQGNDAMKQKISQLMTRQTNAVHEEVKAQDIRTPMYNAIRMMIITGSVMIEKVKDDGIRVFGLRSFACKRDPRGGLTKLIFVEAISKDKLPEGYTPSEQDKDKDSFELYTKVIRDNDSWVQTQEIEGTQIGQEITYTDETLPYEVLYWTLIDGENYGRSYVSQNIGDLTQYETLSKVLTQGSVVASKVILFVNPMSTAGTNKNRVARAKNGDVLDGKADDVTAMQLQKNYDFQIPVTRLDKLERNIGQSFLMQTAIQRDAERVTAEEIRYLAQELETSFAGIYSVLATKFLSRIVVWIGNEIGVKLGNTINTSIIVGVDALSRSAESQKLDAYLARLANLGLLEYVNKSEVAMRYAMYDGIDTDGLIRTEQEVQGEIAKQRQAQAEQQLADSGAASAGKAMGEKITQ